jgi:HTH-type transcriptional regulator, sugar sensing transcriptional regulator
MTTTAREELEALGFGEYEARAYLALLQRGPMTGYQVAKESGIPRPNIYPVLTRLEQRGAVNRTEAEGATRYSALPAARMLENAGRSFSAHLARAREAMREVEEAPVEEQVWNVEGSARVLERARGLIEAADSRLLLSLWSTESARLADEVAAAEVRGVQVTTLCVQACPQECGGCTGRLYRYDVNSIEEPRSLVVIRDDAELLVGQFYADGSARGAVTRMPALVDMARQSVQSTIAVAEIARSAGGRLTGLLDESAREAVRRAGMETAGESWVDRIIRAGRRN